MKHLKPKKLKVKSNKVWRGLLIRVLCALLVLSPFSPWMAKESHAELGGETVTNAVYGSEMPDEVPLLFSTMAGGNGLSFTTELISKTHAGEPLNEFISSLAVSGNGQYIIYNSNSHEVLLDDTRQYGNSIYLYDSQTGATEIVNVDSYGVLHDEGDSRYASISDDGRIVAFMSNSKNLVDDKTHNRDDIFVRDRERSETFRISLDSDGNEVNYSNYTAFSIPKVSGNGKHVIFGSERYLFDTTNWDNDQWGLFARDLEQDRFVKIDVRTDGTFDNYWNFIFNYAINEDGRFVVFTSYDNLADDNSTDDPNIPYLYVRDRDADGNGILDEVGAGKNKTEHIDTIFMPLGSPIATVSISNDGRYIGYVTEDETNKPNAHVYDRMENKTLLFPQTDDISNRKIINMQLSGNGLLAVVEVGEYTSSNEFENGFLYLWDIQTSSATKVLIDDGQASAREYAQVASINDDGSVLAYNYSSWAADGSHLTSYNIFSTTLDWGAPTWLGDELSIGQVSSTFVNLNWTGATHLRGVAQYRIYANDIFKGEVPGDEDDFIVSGLDPDTVYTFRIEASSPSGLWSVNGPTVSGKTTAENTGQSPLIAQARPGGYVDLTWDRAAEGSGVIGYRIYREEAGGSIEPIDVNDVGMSQYTDTGLHASTAYTYQIYTLNGSGGESVYSDIIEVLTPELFITAYFVQAQPSNNLAKIGSDVAIELVGEPNRSVTATIAYNTYKAADGSMGTSVRTDSVLIAMPPVPSRLGAYQGLFTLEEGIAEITDVEVRIADEGGHSQSANITNMPIKIASQLQVDVQAFSPLNNARLDLLNDKNRGKTVDVVYNGTYVLDHVVPDDAYTLTLWNESNGKKYIIAQMEAVQLVGGLTKEVQLSQMYAAPKLTLHVEDPDGAPYAGRDIRVYTDNGLYLTRGITDENGNFTYEGSPKLITDPAVPIIVEVVGDRTFIAKTRKSFALSAGPSNDYTVVMNWTAGWATKGVIAVQVLDEDNRQPLSRTNLSIRDANSSWQIEVSTDENGRFGPINVPSGQMIISTTHKKTTGIVDETVVVAEGADEDVVIYAYNKQEYKVSINEVKYRDFKGDWMSISGIYDSETASAYSFYFTIDGEKYKIAQAVAAHSEYPARFHAKHGDEVQGCIQSPARTCTTLVLGNERDITFDFVIEEPLASLVTGTIELHNKQKPRDITVSLRQAGRTIKTDQPVGDLEILIEQSGQYELVISAKDQQGKQGTKIIPINIEAGIPLNIGKVTINTNSLFGTTSFNPSHALVNAGDTLTFRLSYSYSSQTINNGFILMDIPAGSQLHAEMVTIDGQPAAGLSIDNGQLKIPYVAGTAYGEEKVIRYAVKLDDPYVQDMISAIARISYTKDGREQEEVFGTATAQVGAVSIYAPAEVAQRNILVHGQAPANSQVEIYDNSHLAAIVQASPAGYWKTTLTLIGDLSPSWHTLQAITQNSGEINTSSAVDVLYDHKQSPLEEVWIRHEQEAYLKFVRTFLSQNSGAPDHTGFTKIDVRNMVPRVPLTDILRMPFEIRLKFKDPDEVENVKVWFGDGRSNTVQKTKAEYFPSDQTYRAIVPISSQYGDLYVDYDPVKPYPKWAESIRLDESLYDVMKQGDAQTPENPSLDITINQQYTIGAWRDATLKVKANLTTEADPPTGNEVFFNGRYVVYGGANDMNIVWSATGTYSVIQMSSTVNMQKYIDADQLAPWWPDGGRLEAQEESPGHLELAWTPAADDLWAEKYRIYQDGYPMPIATIPASELSYVVEGLTNGQAYTFQIEAVDPSGKSTMGPTLNVVMGETHTIGVQFNQFKALSPALENEVSKQIRSQMVMILAIPVDRLVKSSIEITGNGLNNGVGVVSWSDSFHGMNREMDRLDKMLQDLSGGYACDKPGRDTAVQRAIEAKSSVRADMVFNTTGTALGLATIGTGVGAPAGAAITVLSLAGGLLTSHIKDSDIERAQEAYDDFMAANPECKPEKDEPEEEKDNKAQKPSVIPAWKMDPSGYVYEVHAENRLSGVKATVLYRENPSKPWEVWDADWWGEVNPQITDDRGRYGWDVPPGQWQVAYEKAGYAPAFSDILDVPPPHFDVNVPLTTMMAPQLIEIKAYTGGGKDLSEEGILFEFNQYMKTSTLTGTTLTVTNADDDSPVSGQILFDHSIEAPDGQAVAERILFKPDEAMVVNGEYQITISNLIQNYVGIPLDHEIQRTVTTQAALTVSTVQTLDSSKVALGTEAAALRLPIWVDVTLQNGDIVPMDVTWDKDSSLYDPNQEGEYAFSGELVLLRGIANPSQITAIAKIVVEQPDAEVDGDEEDPGNGSPGSGDGSPGSGDDDPGTIPGADPIFVSDNPMIFDVILTGEQQQILAFDGTIRVHIPEGMYNAGDVLYIERVMEDVDIPANHHLYSPIYRVYVVKIAEPAGFVNLDQDTLGSPFVSIWIHLSEDRMDGYDDRKFSVYLLAEVAKAQTDEGWRYVGGKMKEEDTVEVGMDDWHEGYYAVMAYDKTFADLSGHWSRGDVEVLISRHIIHGVNDTEFQPNREITRAEMAQLLMGVLDMNGTMQEPVMESPFEDVAANAWYAKAIRFAYEQGVISGYNGKFRPNDAVTREEMAIMLTRAFDLQLANGYPPKGWYTFKDTDVISDWAEEALMALYREGLINGVSANRLAPHESATRAQAAVMLLRVLAHSDKI